MYLSHSKDDLTANRFSSAPAIPHLNIPPLNQAPKSGSSEKSSNGKAKMSSRGPEFVCLVRGETDLSHEHAYFVPPPDVRHVGERAAILELITSKWSLTHSEFTLEDPENMAWLSLPIHRHHDEYSTIFISACLHDVLLLTAKCQKDNLARQKLIDDGYLDRGRIPPDLLREPTQSEEFEHKFELVVLRPSHFLIAGEPMSVLRDGTRTMYYSKPDGLLHDDQDAVLPPFPLMASVRDLDSLNPLLVNLAAALRVRRFKRLNGGSFPDSFHSHARELMDAVLALHEEIKFTPKPNPDARRQFLARRDLMRNASGLDDDGDNDSPVAKEDVKSAGSPPDPTRLPLSQRIASGDFDNDEFDEIFGGNNFVDLPDIDTIRARMNGPCPQQHSSSSSPNCW